MGKNGCEVVAKITFFGLDSFLGISEKWLQKNSLNTNSLYTQELALRIFQKFDGTLFQIIYNIVSLLCSQGCKVMLISASRVKLGRSLSKWRVYYENL